MSKSQQKQRARHNAHVLSEHAFRVADVAYNVLALYGAAPLPFPDGARQHMGALLANGMKTLVLVDSPNRLTGALMLKKACRLRDSLPGGWHKAVLIGWRFEASIVGSIDALNDHRLEVLQIPPALLDRLRTRGAAAELKHRVCFASLQRQYITIKLMTRTQFVLGADELLIVTLDNYVPLSSVANAPDDGGKLAAMISCEPLDLIEYWAVDPDYDGGAFRASWQHWRPSASFESGVTCIASQAVLTLPPRPGPRLVCVRALDVFGLTCELVTTIAAPSIPT
jgi:adenine-specific DNA-methyltransferase